VARRIDELLNQGIVREKLSVQRVQQIAFHASSSTSHNVCPPIRSLLNVKSVNLSKRMARSGGWQHAADAMIRSTAHYESSTGERNIVVTN